MKCCKCGKEAVGSISEEEYTYEEHRPMPNGYPTGRIIWTHYCKKHLDEETE